MPSSNPLWFGYYPGDKPLPKRPDRRFPTPQVDMSDMGLNVALDEAIKVVDAPAEAPGWLAEKFKDDWKMSFNATAIVYKPSGASIYEFESGEVADVAGVNLQLNLFDLVTNPKETCKKFVEKAFASINPLSGGVGGILTNEWWGDLDLTMEKDLWKAVVRGGTPKFGTAGFSAFQKELVHGGTPINLTEHKVFAKKTAYGVGFDASTGDFDLKKSSLGVVMTDPVTGEPLYEAVKTGLKGYKGTQTDVYEEVGKSTLDFVAKKKSFITRNKAYSGFQSSVITAAATELAQNESKLVTALSGDPVGEARLNQITSYRAEFSVTKSFSGMGKSVGKATEAIANVGITAKPDVEAIGQTMRGLQNSVNGEFGLRRQLAEARASFLSTADTINFSYIDSTGTAVTVGIGGKSLATRHGDLALFEQQAKRMEALATDINALTDDALKAVATGGIGRVEVQKFNTRLNVLTNQHQNVRYDGGIYDKYLASISSRYLSGTNSLLTITPLDSSGNPILSEGYKSLSPLIEFNKVTYQTQSGVELIDTFMKTQKVFDNYVWFGKIKPAVQAFTPSYWTKQVLDRTHFFGLVYNDDAEDLGFELIKAAKNPLIRKNVFDVSFTPTGFSSSVSARIHGGKYLQDVMGGWDLAQGKSLIGGTAVTATDLLKSNNKAFFDLINGKKGVDPALLKDGFQQILLGDDEALATLMKSGKDFKAVLLANQASLGLKVTGGDIDFCPENEEILKKLFTEIKLREDDPRYISAFKKRYGQLEALSAKLTAVQQKMYAKVGKYFAPYVRFRNKLLARGLVLRQRVVGVISRGLAKILIKSGLGAALGAATGGLAVVLAPFVEKLINAVVGKSWAQAKKLASAILKGNFSEALDGMMNDAMKATEKVIACGCLVPLFLAFAIFMMMANIIVSISPVDRAKQAISAVGDAVTVPRPEPITPGGCVADSYSVSCNSYNTGDQLRPPCRHGDNDYWTVGKECNYNIPYFAGNPARGPLGDSTSVCKTASPLKDYFGYALDVVPADPANAWIYAPQVGSVANWTLSVRRVDQKACLTCSEWIGCSVTLNGSDGANTYSVFLLHLACTTVPPIWQTSAKPGDPLAKLYDYVGGKHVHIEMTVKGHYVKPETKLCNT